MRVKDLVVEMEKSASYKISGGTDTWHEEILKKFYEQNNYIPREYFVEVKLSKIDENRQYGIGSVIVWKGSSQINFPIIINNSKLNNFDVFSILENGKEVYRFANKDNVTKALSSNDIGTAENMDKFIASPVRLLGGVPQRTVARVQDPSGGQTNFPSIEKMSSLIPKKDLDKIAANLLINPSMARDFYENTGEMIQQVVNLNGYIKMSPKNGKFGNIDLNGLKNAQKQIVMIESDFIDTSKMQPIPYNTVCELRCKTYGSMEDIVNLGALSELKLSTGHQVTGVCLGYLCLDDLSVDRGIFISYDLKSYSEEGSEWVNDTRVTKPFYGFPLNINIDLVLNEMRETSKRIMTSFHPAMSNKYFESDYGNGRSDVSRVIDNACDKGRYYIVTKYNDQYVVIPKYNGSFSIIMFNGNAIYKNSCEVFIVTSVQNIVKISSIEDPLLKKIVGDSKELYLVPQSTFIINSKNIIRIERENLIRPDNDVKKDMANLPKIAMKVDENGFYLSGDSVDGLKKLGSIPEVCSKDIAFNVLSEHGVKEEQIMTMTKKAASNFFNKIDEPVYFYNTKANLFDNNKIASHRLGLKNIEMAKTAIDTALNKLKSYAAPEGTMKLASLLTDQASADVVLSMDYINHDNVEKYIESLDKIKEIINSLAAMLIASRMGLEILDEDNIIKSIKCLDVIVSGLENLKTSVNL